MLAKVRPHAGHLHIGLCDATLPLCQFRPLAARVSLSLSARGECQPRAGAMAIGLVLISTVWSVTSAK
jgi:hypothetical protein